MVYKYYTIENRKKIHFSFEKRPENRLPSGRRLSFRSYVYSKTLSSPGLQVNQRAIDIC